MVKVLVNGIKRSVIDIAEQTICGTAKESDA